MVRSQPLTSLKCVQVKNASAFVEYVKDRNNDFWLSSLADVTTDVMVDRLRTFRVENVIASELFTTCYYAASKDIKTDTDTVIDVVGLGLRKGKVRSKSVPGCAFVFVSDGAPSVLHQARATLDATDKRLPAEERVR